MPLQPWMKLISVDDHLIEQPLVWVDRRDEARERLGAEIQSESAPWRPSAATPGRGRGYSCASGDCPR
jgi:hypothetical protein